MNISGVRINVFSLGDKITWIIPPGNRGFFYSSVLEKREV
jgi:hypothetical protein